MASRSSPIAASSSVVEQVTNTLSHFPASNTSKTALFKSGVSQTSRPNSPPTKFMPARVPIKKRKKENASPGPSKRVRLDASSPTKPRLVQATLSFSAKLSFSTPSASSKQKEIVSSSTKPQKSSPDQKITTSQTLIPNRFVPLVPTKGTVAAAFLIATTSKHYSTSTLRAGKIPREFYWYSSTYPLRTAGKQFLADVKEIKEEFDVPFDVLLHSFYVDYAPPGQKLPISSNFGKFFSNKLSHALGLTDLKGSRRSCVLRAAITSLGLTKMNDVPEHMLSSYLRSITPERRYPTHQLGYKYTIPHDSDEVRGVITTFQKVFNMTRPELTIAALNKFDPEYESQTFMFRFLFSVMEYKFGMRGIDAKKTLFLYILGQASTWTNPHAYPGKKWEVTVADGITKGFGGKPSLSFMPNMPCRQTVIDHIVALAERKGYTLQEVNLLMRGTISKNSELQNFLGELRDCCQKDIEFRLHRTLWSFQYAIVGGLDKRSTIVAGGARFWTDDHYDVVVKGIQMGKTCREIGIELDRSAKAVERFLVVYRDALLQSLADVGAAKSMDEFGETVDVEGNEADELAAGFELDV